MESISLKYIIFAVFLIFFYLIRKSMALKLKEAQESQKQALNKRIRDMEAKEDAEEYEPEEPVFDEYPEDYDEPEEQVRSLEIKEGKVIDEIIDNTAYKRKREAKKEAKPDYEIRDRTVKLDSEKDFSNPSVEDLRNAIIWSEILAPPVSERKD